VTADQTATRGADGAGTSTDSTAEVALRVVRGEPTAEELAALVAVLAARSTAAADGAGTEPAEPASGWTDRARYVRSGRPGFGSWTGWRASALPR
jgi:Acyl-CoA carboxylase epsilon subunit